MRLHHRDAVFIHLDALYPWFFPRTHTHTQTRQTFGCCREGIKFFFSLLLLGSWTNNKIKAVPSLFPPPTASSFKKKQKRPLPLRLFLFCLGGREDEKRVENTHSTLARTHTHSNNKIKKYFWFFLFNSSQRVRLNLRPNFRWSPRPSMCSLRSQHSILRICVSGLVRAWSSERPEMMKFSFYFCFCYVLFVFDCFSFLFVQIKLNLYLFVSTRCLGSNFLFVLFF